MVALQMHMILHGASKTRSPFTSSFMHPSVLAAVKSENNTNTCPPPWVSSLLPTFALPLGPTANAQRNRKEIRNNKYGNFPTDTCMCGEPLEQLVITKQ